MKFWGMGSLVLLGPALARLREQHPHARLILITQQANRELVELLQCVDEAWYLELGSGPRGFLRSLSQLVWRLRQARCDVLIDAEFLTRFSALVTAVSGAGLRVGFAVPEVFRGRFHHVRHPFNPHFHMVENFLTLAEQSLAPPSTPVPLPALAPPPAARALLLEKLEAHGWQAGIPLIVVNPNAGELALERRWPLARFAELIQTLNHRKLGAIVLIGAPSERGYIEQLKSLLPHSDCPIDLAGHTSLAELAALFAEAALLISNDTGPLHLACAVGTPTVAIFGPETPVLFGPRSARSRTLYQNLACSPCLTVHNGRSVRCPYPRTHCVENITVEQAVNAAEELLATKPQTPQAQGVMP
jgi:lipopolysaccharide heptosyltransferase II